MSTLCIAITFSPVVTVEVKGVVAWTHVTVAVVDVAANVTFHLHMFLIFGARKVDHKIGALIAQFMLNSGERETNIKGNQNNVLKMTV